MTKLQFSLLKAGKDDRFSDVQQNYSKQAFLVISLANSILEEAHIKQKFMPLKIKIAPLKY